MRIVQVERGSFKEVVVDNSPFVRIQGLDVPDTGQLLTNFTIHLSEKNGIIQCFNEINHIYAFGHDPENSNFTVSYLVFLGKGCMKDKFVAGSALNTFFKGYLDNRVSKKKSVVQITYKGSGYVRGILLDYNVSVFDEEMHAVTVTFSGKVL